MPVIDTFYVVDFDRSLGSIDANFNLLKESINNLTTISSSSLQLARDKVEADGSSFDVFEYLRKYKTIDLDIIKQDFIKRAQSVDLLEPGASGFMDFLRSTSSDFCIMSYGDQDWQSLKILAAGFADVPIMIVPNTQKSEHINRWYDERLNVFIVPGMLFLDNKSRSAREVVLIDDKVASFQDLNPKARGYLVTGSANSVQNQNILPTSIKSVYRINEIIDHEQSLKQSLNY